MSEAAAVPSLNDRPSGAGGQSPMATDERDAVENQKVLDAIFRSAETGQWETV